MSHHLFVHKSYSSDWEKASKLDWHLAMQFSHNLSVNMVVNICWIFWPAFGCCKLQMLVEICFFTFFALKMWQRKKSKKIELKLKKKFFLSLHRSANWGFCAQKFEKLAKTKVLPAFGILTSIQMLVKIYNKYFNNAFTDWLKKFNFSCF